LRAADDDDSSVGRNGRQRRSAAVEDDEFGVELDRETRALFDVRREDRTGEPASAPAATDRRDTGERCGFEVIGRCVASGARQLDKCLDRRLDGDRLGLRGAAAAHGDDDEANTRREQRGQIARDRGLAYPLAGPEDSDGRERERRPHGRVEAKIGSDIGNTAREHTAREP